MLVLDTNILSEFFKGHVKITARMEAVPDDTPVATTVISYYEILQGRYSSLIKAADHVELLRAQELLQRDEEKLAGIDVLRVDQFTADTFERLRGQKRFKKIGRRDMLIACIAFTNVATLVTRNVKDFRDFPGLKIENWAD